MVQLAPSPLFPRIHRCRRRRRRCRRRRRRRHHHHQHQRHFTPPALITKPLTV